MQVNATNYIPLEDCDEHDFYSPQHQREKSTSEQATNLWLTIAEFAQKDRTFPKSLERFLTIRCPLTSDLRCLCFAPESHTKILQIIPPSLPLELAMTCKEALQHNCDVKQKAFPGKKPEELLSTIISLLEKKQIREKTASLLEGTFTAFLDALTHIDTPLDYEPSAILRKERRLPLFFTSERITPVSILQHYQTKEGLRPYPDTTFKPKIQRTFAPARNPQDLDFLKLLFHPEIISMFFTKNTWKDLKRPESLSKLTRLNLPHIDSIPKIQAGRGKGAGHAVFHKLFAQNDPLHNKTKKLLKDIKAHTKEHLPSHQVDYCLVFFATLIREVTNRHGPNLFLSSSNQQLLKTALHYLKIFPLKSAPPAYHFEDLVEESPKPDLLEGLVQIIKHILLLRGECFFVDEPQPLRPIYAFWESDDKHILALPSNTKSCWVDFIRNTRFQENFVSGASTRILHVPLLSLSSITDLGEIERIPYYIFMFEGTRSLMTIFSFHHEHDALLEQCLQGEKKLPLTPEERDACWIEIVKIFEKPIARKHPTHIISLQLNDTSYNTALRKDTEKQRQLCKQALRLCIND